MISRTLPVNPEPVISDDESIRNYLGSLDLDTTDDVYKKLIHETLHGEVKEETLKEIIKDIESRCKGKERGGKRRKEPNPRENPIPLETGYRERAHLYKTCQEKYNKNSRDLAKRIIEGKDLRIPLNRPPPMKNIEESLKNLWGKEREQRDVHGGTVRMIMDHSKLKQPITENDIIRCIQESKSNAADPDGIRPKDLLKINRIKLVILFNCLLISGKIPETMRVSRTIMIPKADITTESINDWQPISIGSALARPLNKIITKRIDVSKLESKQRGFMPRDGALENILNIHGVIKERRKQIKGYVLLTLDVKKAFDSIGHKSIQRALIKLNFPTFILRFIMSNVNNGSTIIDNDRGSTTEILLKSGLRQGDPLSPLLFALTID